MKSSKYIYTVVVRMHNNKDYQHVLGEYLVLKNAKREKDSFVKKNNPNLTVKIEKRKKIVQHIGYKQTTIFDFLGSETLRDLIPDLLRDAKI